ncbi:polysaccharide biosynthesis/export family protein [Desertivirga arenae]|uniref:polysaccharide biosynthesis/export family protein n=1 Tax=Desertivirga arenae TaxID=2810309 RepID=UPI001A977AC0|nr:polysaccharide biosynthesis/export family protein [Pedobacter sp. SYSU D00823]
MKNFYLFLALCLTGCSASRNLVYFSDLNQKSEGNEVVVAELEPKIQKSDLLNISVTSSSLESNVLFTANVTESRKGNYEKEGYRVNKNGEINFPVVGNVKLEGLTIDQAQKALTAQLGNYVKKPIVNVQFLNFKVTVIGEVNHPSTLQVNSDKITLLEALGMAGDMTAYGKRNNVLVIREMGDKRTMARLNLNKKETLTSPYFYLQQNDVVYVEPDKAKALEYSRSNTFRPLVIATISAVAVITTAFIRN